MKNMYNKSNSNSKDGLEEFFQQKVEEYDFDFREEDWQKLEAKLDSANKPVQRNLFAFLRIAPPIIGLMLLSAAYIATWQHVIYNKETKQVNLIEQEVSKDQANPPSVSDTSPEQNLDEIASNTLDAQKDASRPSSQAGILPSTKNNQEIKPNPNPNTQGEPSSNKVQAEQSPRIANQQNIEEPASTNSIQEIAPPQNEPSSEEKYIASFTEVPPKNEQQRPIRDSANTAPSTKHQEINDSADDSKTAKHTKLRRNDFVQTESKSLFLTSPKIQEMVLPEVKTLASKPKAEPAPFRRWGLALSFAPDVSLTNTQNLSSPGTKFGILGEYFITRRLSVNTGLVYARVNYQVRGNEYDPPMGFWGKQTQGNIPEEIQAVCEVIDIPINLRYYFVNHGRHRLFASAGVSTYFMLTEDYDYEFMYNNNDPDVANGWSVRNENKHYFGIANLSLGYEIALNKQWGLQIEPFIKSPLTGIGFGNVNLFSAGTFVNLKYSFGLKRK